MKKYKVRITEEALADLNNIYSYISSELESVINAQSQYDRIVAGILSLSYLPERYPTCWFLPKDLRDLRRMTIDNYSVFYIVEEEQILIISILYSSSDLAARLSERI